MALSDLGKFSLNATKFKDRLIHEFIKTEHLNASSGVSVLVDGSPVVVHGVAALSNNGKVASDKLGSGTADATTYLRGDGTWAVVSGGGGGFQGFQGFQGTTGSGSQGLQGATGLQGTAGSGGGGSGLQGLQGYTGSQGPQGNSGTQGSQGTQGLQGYTGLQGNPGSSGSTGLQGLQGTQGSAASLPYTVTSANTANTIVLRDGSNAFNVGKINISQSIDWANGAVYITGDSTRIDLYAGGVAQFTVKNAGPAVFSNSVIPAFDNSYSMGGSGIRWTGIWSANGTIQTSDFREKSNINTSVLGLDFVLKLNPVSYNWVNGGNIDTGEFTEEDIINSDGEIIGKRKIPVMVPVKGKRLHFGLISQEVREVLNQFNTDFGGWVLTDISNPDSQQGLRYDQFISPIIKAIQELNAKIDTLTKTA